jgi:carbamate kinase
VYDHRVIVIACGGGGIPVITTEDNAALQGVEAVIDKDHAAALFVSLISADILLILTDVDKVALHYGKPDQKELDVITIDDATKYSTERHFPAGSMVPKTESAIHFVESGGEKAIITSIESATSSLHGNGCTTIHL